MQVTSDCTPSMFAYPPPVTTETKDTGAKVPKAVLSTTAKAKDKAKKKDAEKALKEGRSTADQDKYTSVKPEGNPALHCSSSESGLFTWSSGQVWQLVMVCCLHCMLVLAAVTQQMHGADSSPDKSDREADLQSMWHQ